MASPVESWGLNSFTKGLHLIESKKPIAYRFRGFLPVVVDFETGGFNANTDALLEAAAVIHPARGVALSNGAKTHSNRGRDE